MRKIKFELSAHEDYVKMEFNEKSLHDTIARFFGFLRASGTDEDILKSVAREIIDGKWTNNLSGLLSNQLMPSTILSLTTSQIASLNNMTTTSGNYNSFPLTTTISNKP